MGKKITTFVAMTLICCLCSGLVAEAEEPAVKSAKQIQESEAITVSEPEEGEADKEEKDEAEDTKKESEQIKDSDSVSSEENESAEDKGTEGKDTENEDAKNEDGKNENNSKPEEENGKEELSGLTTGNSSCEADIQNSESEKAEVKNIESGKPEAVQKIAPVPKSKKIRVLFVGNSMTYRKNNTTITNLRKMAKKSGRKLVVKRLTCSNEKMKNWANPKHKSGKRLYREIRSGRWDYIIFQEQTDTSVKKSFVTASKKVSQYIHSKSPKTQIVYNCTWAYKKGRKISGKYYSFSKMQNTMNKNYESAATQTGGRVCWSGKAFLTYRKSKGKKKNLYIKDNNHASKYGWYLNACCLYASIFGKSPTESKYYAGLSKKQAKLMQKIATMQHL